MFKRPKYLEYSGRLLVFPKLLVSFMERFLLRPALVEIRKNLRYFLVGVSVKPGVGTVELSFLQMFQYSSHFVGLNLLELCFNEVSESFFFRNLYEMR